MSRRYPLEPLLAVLNDRGLTTNHHRLLGVSSAGYRKVERDGLAEAAADRVAVSLGLHPSEVWPTWLGDHVKACDECGTSFVPGRRDARFCQTDCYRRWWGREVTRRRRTVPELAERNRQRRRAYYAENAEYEKARERRRYQANRAKSHSCSSYSEPLPLAPETSVPGTAQTAPGQVNPWLEESTMDEGTRGVRAGEVR